MSVPLKPVRGSVLAYVGTYSRGIYVFRFDPATGEASPPELAAELGNPSWLEIHPNAKFLYAASEFRDERDSASAFRIDPATGALTLLNTVPSGGRTTCHFAIDSAGNFMVLANYGSGGIAVRRIETDGSLGPQTASVQHTGKGVHPQRQWKPFPHGIHFSPDNRHVLVADLGVDRLYVYRFEHAAGTLAPAGAAFAELPPGSGPRHLAFHPNGGLLYLINELSATLTTFAWNAGDASLTGMATVKPPTAFSREAKAAEVAVAPGGRLLYASNRGPDTIAVFSIKPDGALELIEETPSGGVSPRHIALDPTASFLFASHQKSGNIVVFRADPRNGKLTRTPVELKIGSPVCVRFFEAQ